MAWYCNKKQNDNYATLSADYSDLSSKITVKAGIVHESEKEFTVYGIFSTVTSIRSKDLNFFFSEQPCKFVIHKGTWEKPTDWNSEQRKFMSVKTVEQTITEKIYCHLFSTVNEFKTGFTGTLNFASSWQESIPEILLNGTQNGKVVSEDAINFLRSTIYEITACDVSSLPTIETTAKTYSSSSKQTEKQRLQDRLEFLGTALFGNDNADNNLHGIAAKYCELFQDDPEDVGILQESTEKIITWVMN